LRKRAFGKQTAQQVGDAKGHKKSVGCDTGAKNASDEYIPHESQNTGYQRHSADSSEGFKQIHG
jgi:hypothetical protein